MKRHIVCFGDSNTHGYCAETNSRFDETKRWCCLLQEMLGDGYDVIEEGLSGRTTAFSDPLFEGLCGMDYLYPCLMSHEPVDLLIVMLGTNDTKERFAASAGCIALGLKRLLDKAYSITDCWRDGVPNVLVITPQNIGREYIHTEVGETMGRGCAEKSEGLAKEYEVVARNRGCDYMDANEVISALPNTIDYMHLTEEAHRELAVALAKRIKEKWSKEA
jgi:lysophospholipase L1-like esterase